MNLAQLRRVPRTCSFWLSLAVMILVARTGLLPAQQPSPAGKPPAARGQELVIKCDSRDMDKNVYHLRGHVEIAYEDMKLTSDTATYDVTTGEMVARGHVLFLDTGSRLAAEEVHYNLKTKQGWFSNGQGFVQTRVQPRPRMLTTSNPFYIQAERVDRIDEDTYLVQHGRLTTCPCEEKGWSISAGSARVEVDDKLITHGAVFRLLDIPLFYSPVMANSIAKTPRKSGFLLPHIGNSSQKGFIFGDGFFWAINPSVDLLLGLENYSVRGPAGRGSFNAKPSEDTDLIVDYFGVDDHGSGPDRQTRAKGQSLQAVGKDKDVGYGFRGIIAVDYITSMAFRTTFTDNFTQAVSSEARQTGFLTKDFDAYSINFLVSRYQNFLSTSTNPSNSVAIRHTPSFEFAGVDKQVGNTPFYFSFDSSVGGVGRTEPDLSLPTTSERLDFHPQLTLRTGSFWGFHFTPTVGLRATRYGASLGPNHDPLTRLLGEVSADLRPPSFEKVLGKTYFGRRVKHVIEPGIHYQLVRARDAENILDVVRYDDMDILTETNEIEYSLTNSLFARKDAPEGGETPQAREVFSFRLSQKYYFDPTFGGALHPGSQTVFGPTISLTGFAFARGEHLSPVVSVLKFAPFSNYDTELRADFNPNGGGVLNAGITSHVRRGPLGLAFTDFFINRTAVLNTPVAPTNAELLPSFHLFRTVATYGDVNRKGFSGAFGLDFNFAQRLTQQVVGQLSYNFGCFGIDAEFRRFDLGPLRRENQYRIALSLANVGTFGNLKRRERLY